MAKSTNKIFLKKAEINDIDKFLDIEKSVADLKTYSVFENEEEIKKSIKNEIVYFIEKEGILVGRIAYEIKNKDHAYLSDLVIKPEFQNQGIAREALALILEELKDKKEINLVVHPKNTPALLLYLSSGFIIESWKDNYFGDGEPRLILHKNGLK